MPHRHIIAHHGVGSTLEVWDRAVILNVCPFSDDNFIVIPTQYRIKKNGTVRTDGNIPPSPQIPLRYWLMPLYFRCFCHDRFPRFFPYFHTVFSITSPFLLLNILFLERKKRGHQQMLSLDSTLRFIRKCVFFIFLLSPVFFSLTGVLDSYLT